MTKALMCILVFAAAVSGQPPLLSDDGYVLADRPREWSFPRDHGRHDGFKIEWWYFTGNLTATDGSNREFGYQVTFFRSQLAPSIDEHRSVPDSAWRTRDLYFAHAAISDITNTTFWHDDRVSRGHPELAEASEATLDVRLLDWRCALGPDGSITMNAHAAGVEPSHAIMLKASPTTEPLLQGPGGLNPKGVTPGHASYYVTLTRLETEGVLRVRGEEIPVEGLTWMDHEFASNQLEGEQAGWDWISIHLDDGRDLMAYQLRTADGTPSSTWATIRSPNAPPRYLTGSAVTFEPAATWRSDATGGAYPQQWTVRIDGLAPITIQTRFTGQELRTGADSDIAYFEGAMEALDESGRRIGLGYIEMTGYDRSLAEEF